MRNAPAPWPTTPAILGVARPLHGAAPSGREHTG
ncbi:uncharacterized protein SOCEGT47_048190 [Sorangium cellulosum]|uniref:Uncharacterized protein n=1 Tax=Sorangium cellulosum TaxID=56 RepID=A0A4V0NDY4_SORCE|nr:uncharacterized protein SOCEGT47_048190 [Sorangium cellulosum]